MQIYEFGSPEAPVVLIEPIHVPEGMDREAELIRELSGWDFRLRAVRVDWFRDLSPWSAPPVSGNIPFGDGAEDTLAEILKLTGEPGKRYILGGYSMGGLFALWAACRTGAFSAVAAASPSVWFPGFTEYMFSGSVRTGGIYLSLGDREEKTRNPVMAGVGDRIREIHAWLQAQGIPCCLEWNEGNHFRDLEERMAKGFAWAIRESEITETYRSAAGKD
ncbi:MAG: esterase [Clostridiales bacterium]|nr:esterase [Clostridiales bacterium]